MGVSTLEVNAIAREFTRRALEGDVDARRRLARAWRLVERDIADELDRLVSLIERRGVRSRNELYRLRRYQQFLDFATSRIERYSAEAHALAVDTAAMAARHGQEAVAHLMKATGVAYAMTAPDEMSLMLAVGRLSAGRAAERFRSVPYETGRLIARAVESGVASGKNPRVMAREVRRAAASAMHDILTITRTETMVAHRAALLTGYRSSRIVEAWRWSAALDDRTCPVCWAMHGTITPVGEDFATHPNCRCSPEPVLVPEHRVGTPEEPTGPEVFAALPYPVQRAILGPARHDAYLAGVPLKAMVERYHHPVWGAGRRLLPVKALKV